MAFHPRFCTGLCHGATDLYGADILHRSQLALIYIILSNAVEQKLLLFQFDFFIPGKPRNTHVQ